MKKPAKYHTFTEELLVLIMNTMELKPNKSIYPSTLFDRKSINFLKNLFPCELVDCEQLQIGGTVPNIDGYLDLFCSDGTAYERVFVQVKHLTHPAINGDAFYDIPQSIYAYAHRRKGEVVIFIACDYENEIFYWKVIDEIAIDEFINHSDHIQETVRYYFKENEYCNKTNVLDVIQAWRELYHRRMDSITDDRALAERFAKTHKTAFNRICTDIHGISESHIERSEVNKLLNWIQSELPNDQHNICLLTGNAGVGKSAVLKDVTTKLEANGTRCICIKADSIDITNPVSLEDLYNAISCFAIGQHRVVVIIDQIDALSQSLSNDRNRINDIVSILSSLDGWSNVRVIVSCRKYDLDYDATLGRLKANAEIIELGELKNEDVDTILLKLGTDIKDKLDSTTYEMLKTVQYLDAYCFLYQKNKARLNFGNPAELYDSLWDSFILSAPSEVERNDLERILFTIAISIRELETLWPVWTPATEDKAAFTHLASSRAIITNGNSVSFFHQTFYDYTLARYYTTNNKSFIEELKNEFQGLEIRSTVKAILEYEKGHNESIYIKEVRELLNSDKIRLHIKLLAISILASTENPNAAERKLIRDVCTSDVRLLTHFLLGARSEKWFNVILLLSRTVFPQSSKGDRLLGPTLNCLSRYSFNHPDEIFPLLDSIEDESTHKFALQYILREHNDYQKEKVRNAFYELDDDMTFIVGRIKDSMLSNIEFGLKETKKCILSYLESPDLPHEHAHYEIVDVLCKDLCEKYPTEYLRAFHECFVQSIKKQSKPSFIYQFSVSNISRGFLASDNTRKLLEMYEALLIKYAKVNDIIKPIVEELIDLNNETSLSLAFNTISENPKEYDGIILTLISSDAEIEKCLNGDIEYYFLKMLKEWYITLNKKQSEAYQKRILTFKSSTDFLDNKERKYSLALYPYLWRHKWILICNTLPKFGLINDMQRCSQELTRRYGEDYIIEKPNYEVSCATVCGGIVSQEKYERFSKSTWLNSFLKLDETNFWRSNRHHIDLNVHASAFERCVEKHPEYFKDFVYDINQRDDIKISYKVAGVKGLLKGGVSLDEIWPAVKNLISLEYAFDSCHSFTDIIEYYLKHDNEYISDIIITLKTILNIPFIIADKFENATEFENLASHLLTKAINSPQGCALKLIVQLCGLPERRVEAYSLLSEYVPRLSNCLNTIPLYYLQSKDYYDEQLYIDLIKPILKTMGIEALFLATSYIQWCFYNKPEIVSDYINRIESDPQSHVILAQIYFYGLYDDNDGDCKSRLEKLLALNNEKVIAATVEAAMKSYSSDKYTALSRVYLERYSSDNRSEIVHAFCINCTSLPADAFNYYCHLTKNQTLNKHREMHCQLDYIKQCLDKYPVDCYRYIQLQNFIESDDGWIYDDEITDILLLIYKKLRQNEDDDALNELMDIFDEYIFRGNSKVNKALRELTPMTIFS